MVFKTVFGYKKTDLSVQEAFFFLVLITNVERIFCEKVSKKMAGECPPILVPETLNCSGRGICASATNCICEDGWTGVGDFAFRSASCAINIKAIQALWGLLACLQFVLAFASVVFLRIKSQQKSRPLSPILLGSFVLLFSTCLGATGMIRAVDPLRTIGTDGAATALFCIGTSAFWTAVNIFIYAFIDLALRQSKMGRNDQLNNKLLYHMKISLPVSDVFSVVSCLVPFGMLNATNAGEVQQLATAHYVLSAAALFVAGIWLAPYFVGRVVSEISEIASHNPAKSGKLQQIVAKLQRFQKELRNQTVTNVVLAVFFGFWPFLQISGSSYFLPFAWTSGAILGFLGLYVNLPVSDKKSSSNQHEKLSSVQPGSSSKPNDTGAATNVIVTHMFDSYSETKVIN